MLVVAFKFIHIVAIAFWACGLIALPFLYRERPRTREGADLHRLHRFVRVFYTAMLSPAAFVAVGSGIVLIFLQQTFEAWFSAKMLLVAIMVLLHVTSGLLILKLFEPGAHYHTARFILVTILNVTVVTAILALVLGKPQLWDGGEIAAWFRPGALGDWAGSYLWGETSRPMP